MAEDVKVFAREPGASVYIGGFGRVTCTEGIRVPAAVAVTLAGVPSLRIDDGTEVPVATATFPEPIAPRTVGVTVTTQRPGRARKEGQ